MDTSADEVGGFTTNIAKRRCRVGQLSLRVMRNTNELVSI